MHQISPDRIEIADWFNKMHVPGAGAVASFLGVVRGQSQGLGVQFLEYEAYQGMALQSFCNIEAQAKQQFLIEKMAIVHRVGVVQVGEPCVLVITAAERRKAALEACSFGIEQIKAISPIWKKEHFINGNASWVANDTSVSL